MGSMLGRHLHPELGFKVKSHAVLCRASWPGPFAPGHISRADLRGTVRCVYVSACTGASGRMYVGAGV